MRGKFIVFEGVEGSGKSTQIKRLKDYLESQGYPVVTTKEPGGTLIGEKIREILLGPEFQGMKPQTELLLYLANRAEHLSQVIKPSLSQGKIVLCDRYSLSTLSYQGYGRRLSLEKIKELDGWVIEGLKPDLTFILLLPVEEGLKRATKRGADRLEKEGLEFHRRVYQGYQELVQKIPESCYLLNASLDSQKIHQKIVSIVESYLKK